jgi:hypothetical protein
MRLTNGMFTTIDTTSLTIRPLSTPWWKPTALLHALQTWITSVAQSQATVRRDIRLDYPRQETPADILARNHTFLYASSLMG